MLKQSVGNDLLYELLTRDLQKLHKDYPSIREVHFPDKGFIYRQGDRCSGFYWIKNGIVKLSHLTGQGNEIVISFLRRGDILGGLQNEPVGQEMVESAQALGEVDSCHIEYIDFKSMLSQCPDLAWSVFEVIYARKALVERKLMTILTQPVEVRVIAALIELAEMFGKRCTHGYALEIHLTQQELADVVGASRSVVSTILNDLRSRGMLDYTREQICVDDSALTSLSE